MSEPCACQRYQDGITSLAAASRLVGKAKFAQIKAEKTIRRVAELADIADRDGIDVCSADIRIALNLEEK